MKKCFSTSILLFLTAALLLQACGPQNNAAPTPQEAAASATPDPGAVVPLSTSVPNPNEAASAYLGAWGEFDYNIMYSMLTTLSQDAFSFTDFETRYRDVAVQASLSTVEFEILQTLTNPTTAQVAYRVTLVSALVGPISRETLMNLSLENGQWKIIWDDTLILPELAGGNQLSMQVYTPTRGIIYDRDGQALAANTDTTAISVIPSNIDEDSASGLLAQLVTLSGIPAGYIGNLIFADDPPYLTPVFEIPTDQFAARQPWLEDYYNMLSWTDYFTRLAYNGSGGAHALGYVSSIPAEEVDEWAQLGYPIDAIVGRQGLEYWGEEYLSGQRGGELYVVSPDRQLRITILASRDPQPSQSIYTTLNANLQRYAQLALGDFTGAVIVLERDTGRILAMASSPAFDPNDADFANPNSEWGSYFDGSYDRPFYNRATQGQYPPGSIFKVITLAAALESGLFTPQSSLFCSHTWNSLGVELEDWTLEKDLPASGELNLLEGLMRSCNPWFYEIGFSLYNAGETTLLAEMARGFGLGSPTGIIELDELSGQITNPDESTTGSQPVFNAVQQAIGQSDTLISPLQAAVYVAAIGNGGTLYQPQLIERIVDTGGNNLVAFEPVANGQLPISESTLLNIQTAMRLVTNNPRGTAYRTFANLTTPIYGKTGTAQNPGAEAHAWFIGYTNAARTDLPDIAIAVVLENMGDGSEFAAPIFARLVEVYFTGVPQRVYPWEERIGIVDPFYFNPVEDEEGGEEEEDDGVIEVEPSP